MGTLHVHVAYKTREKCLPLLAVKGTGISLPGKDWFSALGIGLSGVNQVLEGRPGLPPPLSKVLAAFPKVFKEGLGKSKEPPVHTARLQRNSPLVTVCLPAVLC